MQLKIIEYDLVEDAEEDSDYKRDFDSEEEDSNDPRRIRALLRSPMCTSYAQGVDK